MSGFRRRTKKFAINLIVDCLIVKRAQKDPGTLKRENYRSHVISEIGSTHSFPHRHARVEGMDLFHFKKVSSSFTQINTEKKSIDKQQLIDSAVNTQSTSKTLNGLSI